MILVILVQVSRQRLTVPVQYSNELYMIGKLTSLKLAWFTADIIRMNALPLQMTQKRRLFNFSVVLAN